MKKFKATLAGMFLTLAGAAQADDYIAGIRTPEVLALRSTNVQALATKLDVGGFHSFTGKGTWFHFYDRVRAGQPEATPELHSRAADFDTRVQEFVCKLREMNTDGLPNENVAKEVALEAAEQGEAPVTACRPALMM